MMYFKIDKKTTSDSSIKTHFRQDCLFCVIIHRNQEKKTENDENDVLASGLAQNRHPALTHRNGYNKVLRVLTVDLLNATDVIVAQREAFSVHPLVERSHDSTGVV